jgi:hypothetical protein
MSAAAALACITMSVGTSSSVTVCPEPSVKLHSSAGGDAAVSVSGANVRTVTATALASIMDEMLG